MAGLLEDPLPMGYDQDFESDLKKIQEDDPTLAERIADYCEEIRKKPFKGEMKQYAMDGLYGLHVDPFVLLYELDPHLAPNSDPSNVDEVYFHRVVHHDDQQTAVKNVNRADRTTYVSIRLEYDPIPNVQRRVSQLHETDEFRFKDSTYDSDGISVTGELVDDSRGRNREILEVILPEDAIIEYDREGFSDFI
ncbi:type II toxin-antitoxin system RelE/ParE family toxin [Natrinema thermotolerans]|uniref:Type II toxin-antitoxin system RelE/ParE family toxin n=1 Tax=Natrinema thermotolerans TaxID=121872 RepID=A0AAF0T5S4_9EURY|nr:type II toxin-antitoxin system RelE/ParE family toxin [Natrinema thermotolerans]WPH65869.1 RelE/ParE family toxin [Haloarchaeal virus HJTV-4]QCC60774.1 type II toxin-antitoxin system RelE/ParE family toxin [Natrinema thermotolerans]QCC61654.1 type II toxin-antitoxin system RelE/ParE family toxin [Natrinema thermotolerans]WMT07819.1 type II toxin-antitoxin system RelE/ParE family toxin [Natrinema thermotolerans]WMT08451.1 type II toxin-antitoxin system RelE/ParE family toxin [Natrinema therm